MSIRWKNGAVEIRADKNGSLKLVVADGKSDAKYVFAPTDLQRLFDTLAGSGRNVLADSLVLYGTERSAKGFPVALKADHMKPPNNEGKVYAYAWGPKQVKKFKPEGLFLRSNFGRPVLWAFADDFEPGANAKQTQRRTLDIPVAPKSTGLDIPVAEAAGKAKSKAQKAAELNARLEAAGIKHRIADDDLTDDEGDE